MQKMQKVYFIYNEIIHKLLSNFNYEYIDMAKLPGWLTKLVPKKVTTTQIGVLLALLVLLMRHNNPALFNNLISLIVLTLIFYLILEDWKLSILYATFSVLILAVVQSVLGVREYFDNTSDTNTNTNGITGPINEPQTAMTEEKPATVEMNGKKQTVAKAPETTDDEPTTYDQWTDKDKQDIYNKLDNQEAPVKNADGQINPVQAQRETYRLIDTLKQLQTTVDNMTPTIKAGQKIIQAFDNMGIKPNSKV